MRLIAITFVDCAKVDPATNEFTVDPFDLITRGESVCKTKGYNATEFVRIDYWKEHVEFLVN